MTAAYGTLLAGEVAAVAVETALTEGIETKFKKWLYDWRYQIKARYPR
jgi:hypothetical protein